MLLQVRLCCSPKIAPAKVAPKGHEARPEEAGRKIHPKQVAVKRLSLPAPGASSRCCGGRVGTSGCRRGSSAWPAPRPKDGDDAIVGKHALAHGTHGRRGLVAKGLHPLMQTRPAIQVCRYDERESQEEKEEKREERKRASCSRPQLVTTAFSMRSSSKQILHSHPLLSADEAAAFFFSWQPSLSAFLLESPSSSLSVKRPPPPLDLIFFFFFCLFFSWP